MAERVKDRRGRPRVEASLDAKISTEDGGFEATVRNMSLSGILLESNRPVAEMTILGMRLSIPAPSDHSGPAYAFELTGAVVRCEPLAEDPNRYELAVFLTDMPRESRAALQEFVQHHLQHG